MPEKIKLDLGSLQKTLLLPLWGRAIETRRTHPLLEDKAAAQIIDSLDYDFSTIARNINPVTQYAWIARSIHIDRTIRRFLRDYPEATVVNLGCGLDTTFDRVDNESLQWYDLDLPDVIDLRRKFIHEQARRKFIGSSLFDDAWLRGIAVRDNILFLTAGVFHYFEEDQMREFFIKLANLFPESEAIFDAASPLGVRVANKVVIQAGGMDDQSILRWGMKEIKEIQLWDTRIKVLEEYPMFRGMKKGLSVRMRIVTFESDILKIMSMVHLKFVKQ